MTPMPEPQTEAGRALLAIFDDVLPDYLANSKAARGTDDHAEMAGRYTELRSARSTIAEHLPAIEDEAAKAESARWRRLPGAYRRDSGALEVVVALPESLSWLEDEFPDEVAAVAKAARDAALDEALAAVEGLHASVSVSGTLALNRADRAIRALKERDG